MSKYTHFLRLCALLVIAGMIGAMPACGGGGGGSGGGSDEATLRIVATDAPFPYEDVVSAVVEVHRIEIRPSGAPFETLIEYPSGLDLDLVALRNGAVALLYEGSPAPGDYDAIRIVVTALAIEIVEGSGTRLITEFTVPSGEQTGVKIFVDPAISVTSGLSEDLVLDFDLAGSFVAQGNPATPAGIKGFHFKPVVRAVNASTAGSLTFRVKSDNGTPAVTTDDFYIDGAAYTLTDPLSGDVVGSGSSGVDPANPTVHGFAYHKAIPAGLYDLEIGFRDHDSDLRSLTIQVANVTDLGEILLGATDGVIAGSVTTTLVSPAAGPLEFAVSGATVEAKLQGQSQVEAADVTDGLGAYALSPLSPGTYDVSVVKAGYETAAAQADSRAFGAPDSAVDITLTPKADDVTGTVKDAGGNALVGATVKATVAHGGVRETILEVLTDGSGSYTLAGLPTGEYDIEASAGGGLSATQPLDHVGGAGTVTLDLTLL